MTADDETTCTPEPGPPVAVLAMVEALSLMTYAVRSQGVSSFVDPAVSLPITGTITGTLTLDMGGADDR